MTLEMKMTFTPEEIQGMILDKCIAKYSGLYADGLGKFEISAPYLIREVTVEFGTPRPPREVRVPAAPVARMIDPDGQEPL